ncbi:MAG: glycosyltransferase family 1 protein [Patescibacteria group bacterium]
MKIGIDARCLMQKNYSGVSWYAFNLLENIFRLDQTNEYVLFYNSSKEVRVPEFSQKNVRYASFHFPNKLFNFSLNFFDQPKLDKLIGGVEVFFTPNLHFVSWSKDCKKVLTVHDLSFLRFPNFFTWKSRLWHKLILWKKLLQEADILIADSQSTKNDLMDLFKIKEEKIKMVHLGVGGEFKVMSPNSPELQKTRDKYKLPEEFIFFIGTIEPRKNIEGLIKAYQTMATDCHLVIGGGGGWKNRDTYRLAKNNNKIHFIGYVDEKDKPALYNLAEVLLYPSFYEGFGLPIAESMACGCPVVAGNNSSQAEVLGEAGMIVNPHDINEIKTATELILNDVPLRQKLIERGLERVKKFSWVKTAQKTLDILSSLK